MSNRKRTSEQEPPAVTSSAVAEPPAAANDNALAVGDSEPSFAERVGQRKRGGKRSRFCPSPLARTDETARRYLTLLCNSVILIP